MINFRHFWLFLFLSIGMLSCGCMSMQMKEEKISPQMHVTFQYLPDTTKYQYLPDTTKYQYQFEVSWETYRNRSYNIMARNGGVVILLAKAGMTSSYFGNDVHGFIHYSFIATVHEPEGNVVRGSLELSVLDGDFDKIIWQGIVDVSTVIDTKNLPDEINTTNSDHDETVNP